MTYSTPCAAVSLTTKVRFDQMTTFNVLPIVSWATVNFDWEQHMYGDGEPEMDCSKYGLAVCSKHWQTKGILNNDFQTRFGLDNDPAMVLAQTAGLQTGTIPYLVHEGVGSFNSTCYQRPDLTSKNASNPSPYCNLWIVKSYWASVIVHEVRPSPVGCDPNSYGPHNLSACWIPGSPDGKFKGTPGAFNVPGILWDHGYSDPSCDVYRYYEPGMPAEITGTSSVYPLLVRCPTSQHSSSAGSWPGRRLQTGPDWPQRGAGRVLAIFSSFTPVAKGGDNVKVQLDSSALGLRSGANATDAITQEAISLSGGVLSFWLNAHDFRMITIE